MRNFRAVVLVVLFPVLAACTTVGAERDQMCAEIVKFANATTDTSTHSVELMSDWGSAVRLSPDKNNLYTQKCDHYSYEPGENLCKYLMGNTSIEFSQVNLQRALSCLGAPKYAESPSSVRVERLDLTLWSYSTRGVRTDVRVGIEYVDGSDKAPPSLKILAKGVAP